MHIFGIRIDELNKKEIFGKIQEFLDDGKQHYIVTPNPEILLQAGTDEEFFYVLNQADLNVPDGVGLKFAFWAMFKNLKIYPGADLTKDILKIASEKKLKVVILNWKDGLSTAQDIEDKLQVTSCKLQIIDSDRKASNDVIQKIKQFSPDILFCTFGAPHQEKFIHHNLNKFPSIKLAIGVGASFDYISGKARRAPLVFRKLGLEWFWRLFGFLSKQKVNRKRRIKNAVFKFPWKFFKWRFVLPFFYRKNVACLLFKNEKNKYKILLVERQNEKNHWQLPQGGTDGDSLEVAGKKELFEEIGNKKFKLIASFKNLYKYKFWDDIAGKYGSGGKPRKHSGYRGQSQGLFIAEYFGDDSNIKINEWDHSDWKWVDINNLVDEVHDTRKKAAKIFLEKFREIVK